MQARNRSDRPVEDSLPAPESLRPELRVLTERIEERLKRGGEVSQDEWDKIAEMFEDDPDEAPMSPAMLEQSSRPVDDRLRNLIKDALADLASNDE